MTAQAEEPLSHASPGTWDQEVPEEYLAAHLRDSDTGMFQGMADKDVRKSLRLGPVPMPELAPDEVLVAIMASSVNYNTVWSAMFEPLPTFEFLKRYGKVDKYSARHDQSHHVIGSDAAGVVVRTGAGVTRWQPGAHVLVSCIQVDDHEPATHADSMVSAGQRAWGFETNFGGLAHYGVVKASQLVSKPAHLTWEEAGSSMLTATTSYRMLIGDKGARIKLGDVVLIWGAAGGLGAFAVQLVKNAGGIAVGVVSSAAKVEAARRLGCDVVIDRSEFASSSEESATDQGKRLGRIIRREVGEDPHVVFDHVGRVTFGVSVFVVRRGGAVVTCGSSTGYLHEYDNRYLWMNSKRILGCHAANLNEQAEVSRLFSLGKLYPVLSDVYPLDQVADAVRLVQQNEHMGKVGVLCMAPEEGLGVTDPGLREKIGAERLNPLRKI